MFDIVSKRKIWFSISGVLVLTSLVLFFTLGLKLGVDFTGGSLLELQFASQRPSNQEISNSLQGSDIGQVQIQALGERGVILRFNEITQEQHQSLISQLETSFNEANNYVFSEERFVSIGPSIGKELQQKTIWAMVIVIVAIILYIAWAFRKVSQPVASWKYGLIAIIALFHDIMLTIGLFVIMGHWYGVEINAPFVAALLTILGYSVNDTIVIFDRTRENLKHNFGAEFKDIVKDSLNQVITRSINVSFTTLFVLFSVFLLGGETVRSFILTLIVGISVGTYSSIFLAAPLLVTFEKIRKK